MFAKSPRVFYHRSFLWAALPVAVLGFALLAVNLFHLGEDVFIFSLNSAVNFPLSLLVAVASASLWKMMSAEKRNRLLWSGLLLGWTLWAIAEAIWSGYAMLGREAPYPSMADIFWIAGYFPMIAGLVLRAHFMPAKPNPLQTLAILLGASITALLTILFLFVPIVQNFASQKIVESVPSFVYPLGDLIVLSVVWRLFFAYEEGAYGGAWKLLIWGFLCVALSDFFYTFATLRQIYYPGMKANFISRFVDFSYSASYLLWFLGIYALRSARKTEEKPLAAQAAPAPKVRIVRTYGHILIYTQSDDAVLEVSANFGKLFGEESPVGKSFAEALTLSEQNARLILDTLRAEGKIADFPVYVRNISGSAQEVKVSGLAIFNNQKQYLGANLLLRMRTADKAFDENLDSSSRAMIRFLLEKSGSNNKAEIAQFLADYYAAYLRALIETASRQGGAALVQALMETLEETAQARGWEIRLNPQTIVEGADYPLETLREALPALLDAAKKFIADVSDSSVAEARLKEVALRFSDTVRRDVERYQKAGSEAPLAERDQEMQPAPRR